MAAYGKQLQALRVEESEYIVAHGRKPAGVGDWIIGMYCRDAKGEPVLITQPFFGVDINFACRNALAAAANLAEANGVTIETLDILA
jgi:hypothetical protein